MEKYTTTQLKSLTISELEQRLAMLKESAEAIRHINRGHGGTPEFWNFVIEQVKIQTELTTRRLQPETF